MARPSLLESMDTIKADRATIVIPAGKPFALASNVDAVSLADVLQRDWS